jgi:hypothetical protein
VQRARHAPPGDCARHPTRRERMEIIVVSLIGTLVLLIAAVAVLFE